VAGGEVGRVRLDYIAACAPMGRKGYEKEAARLGRELRRRRAVV
jgi:hypothetical protein